MEERCRSNTRSRSVHRYSQWNYTPSPALTGKETSVSFWVKDTVGTTCMVSLVDSTGQTLQYDFPYTSTNWRNIQIPLVGGSTGNFYGGANDGLVHPPVSSIGIGPLTATAASGVMCIDDLYAYNGNEAVNIDLSLDRGAATYRASGVLNFNSNTSYPPNSMVTPLKMTTARGAMNCFTGQGMFPAAARLTGLGMRIQVSLNDNFGNCPPWPGDNGDWTAWDNYVSRYAHDRSYYV